MFDDHPHAIEDRPNRMAPFGEVILKLLIKGNEEAIEDDGLHKGRGFIAPHEKRDRTAADADAMEDDVLVAELIVGVVGKGQSVILFADPALGKLAGAKTMGPRIKDQDVVTGLPVGFREIKRIDSGFVPTGNENHAGVGFEVVIVSDQIVAIRLKMKRRMILDVTVPPGIRDRPHLDLLDVLWIRTHPAPFVLFAFFSGQDLLINKMRGDETERIHIQNEEDPKAGENDSC